MSLPVYVVVVAHALKGLMGTGGLPTGVLERKGVAHSHPTIVVCYCHDRWSVFLYHAQEVQVT